VERVPKVAVRIKAVTKEEVFMMVPLKDKKVEGEEV
jgi:hypothetical protein